MEKKPSILKSIVAYISWQQYASNDSYYRPGKTLCSTFWLFVFSVLMIPGTFVGNIINIFIKPEMGVQSDKKLNWFVSGMIHILILFLSAPMDAFLEIYNVNILTFNGLHNNFWLTYIKAIGLGIVSLLIIIIVAILIFYIVMIVRKFILWCFQNQFKNQKSYYVKPKVTWFTSFKEKYCPIMDWTNVF